MNLVDQNKRGKRGDAKKNKENDQKSEPEKETDIVVINTSDIETIKVKPPKKAKTWLIFGLLHTQTHVCVFDLHQYVQLGCCPTPIVIRVPYCFDYL